jgi:hypothetical protein
VAVPDATAVGELVDELVLPPIFCPLEPGINPALPSVERRAIARIDTWDICADARERRRVIGTRSADFYARFAPEAGEDGLLAAALWVYWGFAFDDARCDAGFYRTRPAEFLAMACRVQRALECPAEVTGDDAYARALQDVAARVRRVGTPVGFQRFVAAHRAWLMGVAWQIGNEARGVLPGLEDYLTMRLHSAGGEPTYALLEIANRAEVPAAEMDAPGLRALTEMAILVAGLDNDGHSLVTELGRGGAFAGQNIYTVLRRERGGSPGATVFAARCLRDRVLSRFLRLRERIRPGLSEPGRRYVDGLAYGIRGNAEWGLRTPRYATAGDGEREPPEITWADKPLDDSRDPLPIPTIAWWWDV